jgi:hypothetical protein
VLAVVAAHAGEPAFKVAAVEELIDHLRDDGAQEAVARLVPFLVGVQKPVKILLEALPQGRCLGSARTIDLLHHADQCIKEGVSSNGTPLKKD